MMIVTGVSFKKREGEKNEGAGRGGAVVNQIGLKEGRKGVGRN